MRPKPSIVKFDMPLVANQGYLQTSRPLSRNNSQKSSKSILKNHLNLRIDEFTSHDRKLGVSKDPYSNCPSNKSTSEIRKPNLSVKEDPNKRGSCSKTHLRTGTSFKKRELSVSFLDKKVNQTQPIPAAQSNLGIFVQPKAKPQTQPRPQSSKLEKTSIDPRTKPPHRPNKPTKGSRLDLKRPSKSHLSMSVSSETGTPNLGIITGPIELINQEKTEDTHQQTVTDLVVQMEGRIDELLVDMLYSSLDESRSKSRAPSVHSSNKKPRSSRESFEKMADEMPILFLESGPEHKILSPVISNSITKVNKDHNMVGSFSASRKSDTEVGDQEKNMDTLDSSGLKEEIIERMVIPCLLIEALLEKCMILTPIASSFEFKQENFT
jgi:hypothetical protein